MSYYEDSIREAVEQHNIDDGNLMPYFDKEQNSGVKSKVLSAIPSVEIQNGELMGCTTVKLREPLTDAEMKDFQDYLKGQFSDGWGEGFEQREIQTGDGVLYVHFGEEPFDFEVEQGNGLEYSKASPVPNRPQMKLVGEVGSSAACNIFAILGRASKLLRENGQPEKAKEMSDRVYQSGNYYRALHIISEYVETEPTGARPVHSAKKERGEAR